MIGQRATATLWKVLFRYRKRTDQDTWALQHGQRLVLTADPTGADLLDVARLLELGATPYAGHEFSFTETHRIEDISGLIQLATNDRGWPAGLEVGAVVLDATGRAQATIGDLRKALILKDIAIAELEKQLHTLQRGVEEPRA